MNIVHCYQRQKVKLQSIVFVSGMYGDGNSQHQHEPVRFRLFHAAAHQRPDVIRHLHRRPTQQESRGIHPTARKGHNYIFLQITALVLFA